NGVVFSVTGNSTVAANGSQETFTVTPNSPIDFSNLNFLEKFSGTFTVSETVRPSNNEIFTVVIENNELCEFNNLGNDLKISDLEFDVDEGFGDEDDEWFPLDRIKVEVEVENNAANDDINDIEVEWFLFTVGGEEVMDGDESDFDLNDGDDDTVTIEFQVDPDDLDEDEEDYIFHVRATGEHEGFDDNNTCASDFQNIEITIEDDFVILDDIRFSETVSAGSELSVTADVWNVGSDDQDDVLVRVFISELGIDERVEIGDIDSLDSEPLDVTLNIPEDAENKFYTIKFQVFDEDNDLYENDKNDDESEFGEAVKVEGGVGSVGGVSGVDTGARTSAIVSASLESGGQAGEELAVRVTITNTGDDITAYTLNAAGFGTWASSANLDQTALLLNAGESQDVLIEFEVKESTSGDQSFDLEVLSGNQLVVRQPVAVTVEEARGGFPGITGGVIGINASNWYLWGIGALNVLLVIIIIIVAVRIARR
ncbi:MAG: putative S-layer protein, partial [Candidatus Nanoarchaeia archaeon]